MDDFKREFDQIVKSVEQKKNAAMDAEVKRQKAEGHCSLNPFPPVVTQPFRSES